MKLPISAALIAGSAMASPAIGPDNAFTRHMMKTAALVEEVVNAPKTDAMIEEHKGKTSPLDFGVWHPKDVLAYKKKIAGNSAEFKDSVDSNVSLLNATVPVDPPHRGHCDYIHFEYPERDGRAADRETIISSDFMFGGRPHRIYQGLKTGACIPYYDMDNKLTFHYMVVNAPNDDKREEVVIKFLYFRHGDENCENVVSFGRTVLDPYVSACVNHLHGPITKVFTDESDCYLSRFGGGEPSQAVMYAPPDLFNTILGPIFEMYPGDVVIGGDQGFSYSNSYDDVPPVIDIPRSIILDIPPISGFGIDFSRNHYKYMCNTIKSMGISVQQQAKGTRSCEPVDYALWQFYYQGPQCFYSDFIPYYMDIQCVDEEHKPPVPV